MDITIITTTRNRPLAFSFLEKWVAHQTIKPARWLVVNDGTERYTYTQGQQVILRDTSQDKLHSLCENWLTALEYVKDEAVVVMEDDDYYHPGYLETMTKLLARNDLAGINNDFYYHFGTRRFKLMRNIVHASLAATAFAPATFPLVRECAGMNDFYIDMNLWERSYQIDHLRTELIDNKAPDGKALHVGLKGFPGEKGLGLGHRGEGSYDPTMQRLVDWIGFLNAKQYHDCQALRDLYRL